MKKIIVLCLAGLLALGAHSAFSSVKSVSASYQKVTGLNALLEGRSIFIPEIGDWIRPKEGFRVFRAINPKTVGYVGRNTQDAANDDRFPSQSHAVVAGAEPIAARPAASTRLADRLERYKPAMVPDPGFSDQDEQHPF